MYNAIHNIRYHQVFRLAQYRLLKQKPFAAIVAFAVSPKTHLSISMDFLMILAVFLLHRKQAPEPNQFDYN